ncbi:probable transmembrane ascorbate ferrireductase 4 [Phoenix dactylifera]|uniref:Probable transmembrane ascorbate ferrireductase 4 n=1 Tax=Phoenix dactylifera TaxID=42345 RepID=A0A8B7CLW2_PHODC|nr:probable transmembrane ascorbate ferrireductase 4 [Phoenix dactylifera]
MAGLLALARISGVLVAILVLVWTLSFRTTFLLPISTTSAAATSQLDHLYSVLHPLLMVIGFILLSGEGILAHRWLSGWSRKWMHLSLQGAALGFGLFGIWAKFKGNDGILANFYSLHSWMGLLCVALFAAQWVVGFLSFWRRGEGRRTRAALLPWHVFAGIYTYGLSVATAETGLLEKLTFLHINRGLPRRSPEATLVNALGLALAVLCGLVVLAAVSPKQRSNKDDNIATIKTSHCYSNGHQKAINFVQSYNNDDGTLNGKGIPF